MDNNNDIQDALLDDIHLWEPFPPDRFLNRLPVSASERWDCGPSCDGTKWYIVDEWRGPDSRIRVWTREIRKGVSVGRLIHDDMVHMFLTNALDNANIQVNIERYLEAKINARMWWPCQRRQALNAGLAFRAAEGDDPATTVIIDCRRLDCPYDVAVLNVTRSQLIDSAFDPVEALRRELERREKILDELVQESPYKGDRWHNGQQPSCGPQERKRWTLTLTRFMEYEVLDELRKTTTLLDAVDGGRKMHHAGQWLKQIYKTSFCHEECQRHADENSIDGVVRES